MIIKHLRLSLDLSPALSVLHQGREGWRVDVEGYANRRGG